MERYIEEYFKKGASNGNLHIGNKFFGDRGCAILKNYLASATTEITSLELDANNITSDGVGLLSSSIASLAHLRHLSFEWNPLKDDRGLQLLCEAVSSHPSVESLNLRECQIGHNGASYISELIRANQSIRHIDLSHNQIGSQGVVTILNALHENSSIVSLDVTGNGAGYDQSMAIDQLLRRNQSSHKSLDTQRLQALQQTVRQREDEAASREDSLKKTIMSLENELSEHKNQLLKTAELYSIEKERALGLSGMQERINSLEEDSALTEKCLREARACISSHQSDLNHLQIKLQEKTRLEIQVNEELGQKNREFDHLVESQREKQRIYEELRIKYDTIHKEKITVEEKIRSLEHSKEVAATRDNVIKEEILLNNENLQRQNKALQDELKAVQEVTKKLRVDGNKALEEQRAKCLNSDDRAKSTERFNEELTVENQTLKIESRHLQDELLRKDEHIKMLQTRFDKQLKDHLNKETELQNKGTSYELRLSEAEDHCAILEQKLSSVEAMVEQKDSALQKEKLMFEKIKKEVQDAQQDRLRVLDDLHLKERQMNEYLAGTDASESQRRQKLHKSCSDIKGILDSVMSS